MTDSPATGILERMDKPLEPIAPETAYGSVLLALFPAFTFSARMATKPKAGCPHSFAGILTTTERGIDMPAKHTRNRRRKRRRRALVCLLALTLLLGGVAAGWHYRTNLRYWLVPSAPTEFSSLGAPAGATTTQPSTTTQPPSTTTQPLPAKYVLTDVPVIAQYPNYPTGCESVSAVIAMRYAGSDISIDDFIDKYLQKGNFYTKDGVTYGPDPRTHFVGSPRSENSYGCMAPVIENAMNAYYQDKEQEVNADYPGKKRVVNATGTEMDDLCRQYIVKGIPCLVWVSIGMVEPYYSRSWNLPNGGTYRWLPNEHCMVLIGYDATHYYFSDPYRGAIVKYARQLSSNRYAAYGKQALAILPN